LYKYLFRPILFLLEPELAHNFTRIFLKIFYKIPGLSFLATKLFCINHPKLKRQLWGLNFENPVGLAAGFDKDALLINEMKALGFGFIEVGTLTPKPQSGNSKPRLFRLRKYSSLLNRMGFNNRGVGAAVEKLKKRNPGFIVGGNIGKNKDTLNELAVEDYIHCFESLHDWVDYLVVNVSSPNTPGLRALQEKGPLTKILMTLQRINRTKSNYKPLLLKIAPDLNQDQLDDIIDIVKETKIDGIVATNTTTDRTGMQIPKVKLTALGEGGISGRAIRDRSTTVIKYLHHNSKGAFPIIGVGGIMSPADALEKLEAGASLVQIYTGFVYQGPFFVKRINQYLAKNQNQQAL